MFQRLSIPVILLGFLPWPKSLQRSGYRTAYFGKYHMGEENDEVRGGFDRFVTHRGQGKYFDTEFRFDGGESRVVPGYYTTVVTEMADEFIRQQSNHDQPWAMIVGHKAPHSFYIPEPKYEHAFDHVNVPYPTSAFELQDNDPWYQARLATWHGIYGPLFDFRKEWPDTTPEGNAEFAQMVRSYWGTILSVDDSVGQLLKTLEETGQLDQTLVIFTSDNGLLNGEHGMIDKRTAHEPSIRIPLLVRNPALVEPNTQRVENHLTLTVDLANSILEVCGADPLSDSHGRSWVSLLNGSTAPEWRTSFLYSYDYEKQFPYTPNVRAVRTDRWKLIRYPHGDGSADRHQADLFDLQADPEERHNLINDPAHAELVEQLNAEMHRLQRELGIENDSMPIDEGIGQALPDATIR
jgi:arylsulfatase A-like enzyme